MSRTLPNRDVGPLINLLRGILRGRPLKANPLRFTDKLAARTQPQPNLPGGPYAKLTDIYYYTRDGRREVQPPEVVDITKQLQSKKEPSENKLITPGKFYNPE
ncbi:NADH dehydrogenase [ubiquinone] 1 alpha subcomplex subunit 7-like [Phymastichus coffea]|uniref:NADH dehydrogenase [ubiquinone] 1 alpha subcomplex subunit 7-like n=1 Tax=Phymastichus coffea TaxID=108790 RepID=UPI00273BE1B0|nr:NADH dehydrogenase [ubiquinone] 1 alpha subcomplex subunit 7-like [Phymastichus coffea]